jgi:hypothetical protein
MPPMVAFTLGLMGAAAAARWCVKEVRRVNSALDNIRATEPAEAVDRAALPKLRRDPRTGEYRPG